MKTVFVLEKMYEEDKYLIGIFSTRHKARACAEESIVSRGDERFEGAWEESRRPIKRPFREVRGFSDAYGWYGYFAITEYELDKNA